MLDFWSVCPREIAVWLLLATLGEGATASIPESGVLFNSLDSLG